MAAPPLVLFRYIGRRKRRDVTEFLRIFVCCVKKGLDAGVDGCIRPGLTVTQTPTGRMNPAPTHNGTTTSHPAALATNQKFMHKAGCPHPAGNLAPPQTSPGEQCSPLRICRTTAIKSYDPTKRACGAGLGDCPEPSGILSTPAPQARTLSKLSALNSELLKETPHPRSSNGI